MYMNNSKKTRNCDMRNDSETESARVEKKLLEEFKNRSSRSLTLFFLCNQITFELEKKNITSSSRVVHVDNCSLLLN